MITFLATRVILTVCLLILLWLSVSYVGMQRSLRWWQARQSDRQWHAAEGIRDGALQDSFAMRRSLELALTPRVHRPEPAPEQTAHWLAQIETIQQDLEALSHHLSPPYWEDNFPLAVRSLLERWHRTHPGLTVATTLPHPWCQESGEAGRIVLMALDELLRLTLPADPTPIALQVSLQQQEQVQELIIHMSAPNLAQIFSQWNTTELNHLRQAFHCLTLGRCYRQSRVAQTPASTGATAGSGADATVSWHFRWRSHPSLFPFLPQRT